MADPSIVDRDLVEDLLSDATHPDADYERVEASTLAALCRAWLAVDEAPVGVVDILTGWDDGSGAVEVHYDQGRPGDLDYKQRVRIVKEVG